MSRCIKANRTGLEGNKVRSPMLEILFFLLDAFESASLSMCPKVTRRSKITGQTVSKLSHSKKNLDSGGGEWVGRTE